MFARRDARRKIGLAPGADRYAVQLIGLGLGIDQKHASVVIMIDPSAVALWIWDDLCAHPLQVFLEFTSINQQEASRNKAIQPSLVPQKIKKRELISG